MAQSKYILATYSPKPGRIKKCRFIIDYVLTADNCKPRRVKKHQVDVMTYSRAGSEDADLTWNFIKRDKTLQKQNQIKLVVEAFQGLPGPNSRLFMGCQAAELNHLTKPFKMGLQLTNHRFNFDNFRFSMRVTCQTFGGSCQDYLDRSGLLDEGRLTRGFRWIHQASKPWVDTQLQGSFQSLCCFAQRAPK